MKQITKTFSQTLLCVFAVGVLIACVISIVSFDLSVFNFLNSWAYVKTIAVTTVLLTGMDVWLYDENRKLKQDDIEDILKEMRENE